MSAFGTYRTTAFGRRMTGTGRVPNLSLLKLTAVKDQMYTSAQVLRTTGANTNQLMPRAVAAYQREIGDTSGGAAIP